MASPPPLERDRIAPDAFMVKLPPTLTVHRAPVDLNLDVPTVVFTIKSPRIVTSVFAPVVENSTREAPSIDRFPATLMVGLSFVDNLNVDDPVFCIVRF